MEIMNLNGFLAKSAAKLISKGLESKLGFKPDMDISSLIMTASPDDQGYISVNFGMVIKKKDLDRIVEEVTK